MILNQLSNIRKEIYKGYNPWLKFRGSYRYYISIKEPTVLPFITVDGSTSILEDFIDTINIDNFINAKWSSESQFQFRILKKNEKEILLLIDIGGDICQIVKVTPDDFIKFNIHDTQ